MNDKDRIRLAEAMGWCEMVNAPGNWYPPRLPPQANALGHTLPDPFTDANDDYSVLLHMKNQPFSVRNKFVKEYGKIIAERNGRSDVAASWWMFFHETGDYARAALKVLDD